MLELASSVQVSRQGIHDRDREIVAYEMRFRPMTSRAAPAGEADQERATSHVISSVFSDFGVADVADSRALFINVTRAFIVGDLPLPDAPEQVVVEVAREVGVDPAILRGIDRLKRLGFRIALDDWAGEPDRDPLLAVSDVVTIDLSRTDLSDVTRLVDQVASVNPDAVIVATRVEDSSAFQAAHERGVALFQGPHLERPVSMQTPQLAPSEIMCLRLLGILGAAEVSISEIEAVVSADPGLAVRVLRTASSAAAAGQPVTSLRQALTLIGPRMLGSWVVLMLVGGTGRLAQDQVVTMLARARSCSTLAVGNPHVAYTAGLLSGVSEILGVSVVDTVRTTGIGSEVADALVGGLGSAGTALRAVLAHERRNPHAVVANGFTPYQVSLVYLAAVRAANAMSHTMAA